LYQLPNYWGWHEHSGCCSGVRWTHQIEVRRLFVVSACAPTCAKFVNDFNLAQWHGFACITPLYESPHKPPRNRCFTNLMQHYRKPFSGLIVWLEGRSDAKPC
jgi:hypothetical protein